MTVVLHFSLVRIQSTQEHFFTLCNLKCLKYYGCIVQINHHLLPLVPIRRVLTDAVPPHVLLTTYSLLSLSHVHINTVVSCQPSLKPSPHSSQIVILYSVSTCFSHHPLQQPHLCHVQFLFQFLENFIKSSALNIILFEALCYILNNNQQTLLYQTEVCGLATLFNLKSEIEIFLMSSNGIDLYMLFKDEKCIYNL